MVRTLRKLSSDSFTSTQEYITKMDPASTLGLSTESVHSYSISHVKRVLDMEPPELPPCRRGVTSIAVTLKGQYSTPRAPGQDLGCAGHFSPSRVQG